MGLSRHAACNQWLTEPVCGTPPGGWAAGGEDDDESGAPTLGTVLTTVRFVSRPEVATDIAG